MTNRRPGEHDDHDGVAAQLAFHAAEDTNRPHFYTFDPPPGVPALGGDRCTRTVRIRDGWHTVTGGSRAVAFDHNVRSNATADATRWASTTGYARTANWVHNDYTARSAGQRAAEILGEKPPGRYAFVNLWRPIVEPVCDSPLAVCDGRTIAPGDVQPASLIYPDRVGEYALLRYSAGQNWFYFPRMRRPDVLLLKCMDSAVDGRTRFSAHTAFADPTSPPGSPSRKSIEVRVLVLWD